MLNWRYSQHYSLCVAGKKAASSNEGLIPPFSCYVSALSDIIVDSIKLQKVGYNRIGYLVREHSDSFRITVLLLETLSLNLVIYLFNFVNISDCSYWAVWHCLAK